MHYFIMNIGKRFFILLVGVLVAAGWGINAQAQSTHLTSQSLGLGGGGTAYIDGYHANFVNPANLMLGSEDKPRVSLGILGGLSTNMGGPLVNISVYNTYFTTGDVIEGDLADEALTKWFGSDPSRLKRFGVQTDFIPIGLSYRSDDWGIGLAIRSRLLANAGINKGFAQLGILGFQGDVFADGQPVNFSFKAMSMYEVSAGYSMKLMEIESLFGIAENIKIYAGVAPKLLLGANSTEIDFNSVLTLDGPSSDEIEEIRHQFTYSLQTTGELSNQLLNYYNARQTQDETPEFGDYVDPVAEDFYGIKASGLGVDLGGTIEMDLNLPGIGAFFRGPEHLQVGLSITDLGGLSFTENIARFEADDEFVWRGFDFDEERIDEEFDGDRNEYINHVLQDSIANEIYGSYAPQDISKITRTLPARINFGSRLTLNKLSVSLDFASGFNHTGTNSKRLTMSTGVEYDLLGFLPLRVGVRTGGYSSTSYSAGFGLDFRNLEFSFAASNVPNSAQNGTNYGVAWSGLVLRF
jgi:hypothetical protein